MDDQKRKESMSKMFSETFGGEIPPSGGIFMTGVSGSMDREQLEKALTCTITDHDGNVLHKYNRFIFFGVNDEEMLDQVTSKQNGVFINQCTPVDYFNGLEVMQNGFMQMVEQCSPEELIQVMALLSQATRRKEQERAELHKNSKHPFASMATEVIDALGLLASMGLVRPMPKASKDPKTEVPKTE